MHVLIVEDNAFNAICLTRLFALINNQLQIKVVNNSLSAFSCLSEKNPDLIILDGDLGASDSLYCNGPTLADLIWRHYPQQSIVAWSDSEIMRTAFAEVFRMHNKLFNEYSCWPKVVNAERIGHIFSYLPSLQNADRYLEKYLSQYCA